MIRQLLRPVFVLLALFAHPALAADPFEHGWQLDQEASAITFLSIKKDTVAETSQFAAMSGQITERGVAQLVSLWIRSIHKLTCETFVCGSCSLKHSVSPKPQ